VTIDKIDQIIHVQSQLIYLSLQSLYGIPYDGYQGCYLVIFALQLFHLAAQCQQITLGLFQLPATKSSFSPLQKLNSCYIKIQT